MNGRVCNLGGAIVPLWRAPHTLLPLGRRCPEGADEGAFPLTKEVAPHQFGQMTYGRASELCNVARTENATVSHGLTSSPPKGRGGTPQRRWADFAKVLAHWSAQAWSGKMVESRLLPWGVRA
jgi:hypothetical protein